MANSFYSDASAMAKRYNPEIGSAQVDAILDAVSGNRVYVLNVGVGEVVSILVRKRNAGRLSPSDFGEAMVKLATEIAHAADVNRASVSNRLALSSFSLIEAHSINSTDAIMLRSALVIGGSRRFIAATPAVYYF
jgi:predicted nucleic acid-binding protein